LIKYPVKIFFLLFTAVIFYSCSKTEDVIVAPVDTSTNFRYPYSLNSNWFFTTTSQYTFHPDSVRNYIDEETPVEVGYSIWRNDTVVNGVTAKVLVGNHTSSVHSYNTVECFAQTDTGLVSLSFEGYGPGFGPFRPNSDTKYLYNGKEYFSVFALTNEFIGDRPVNDNSELTNFNTIRYPITLNIEWYFRTINLSPLQIQKKKYLNYEQVQTPAGTYNCIKIQRKNYTGSPQILDTNYISYDYFSKVGMIKRSYVIKNIACIYNSQLIGYFDLGGEVILNTVNIIP
jgi:hypothetical protein